MHGSDHYDEEKEKEHDANWSLIYCFGYPTGKGPFSLSYKNCSNLGCMQKIACKNRQAFYTTHPSPSNF